MSSTTSLEQFNKATNLLMKANRIKIFGYNRTGFSALQFRYRAAKLPLDCEAITDTVVMEDVGYSLKKVTYYLLFQLLVHCLYTLPLPVMLKR